MLLQLLCASCDVLLLALGGGEDIVQAMCSSCDVLLLALGGGEDIVQAMCGVDAYACGTYAA